jgi:hypothetical protein
VALNNKRERTAGFAIALALFKPHLILPIAVFLIWKFGYRFLQGFLCGGAVVTLISTCITGIRGWQQMLELWHYGASSAGHQIGIVGESMPNLRGMMAALGLGAHSALILTAIFSVLLFMVVAWRLRSEHSPIVLFPPLIALALLVCFHLNAHDLTILIVPVLALLVEEKKSTSICAAACFCMPIFLMSRHTAMYFLVICYVLFMTIKDSSNGVGRWPSYGISSSLP